MKYDSYLDNIEHNISFYVYIRNCFEENGVCLSIKTYSSAYEPKAI